MVWVVVWELGWSGSDGGELLEEEGEEEDEGDGAEAHDESAEGLGAVALLGGHFAEFCYHSEVGVVGMRDCHCTSADGHYAKDGHDFGAHTEGRKNRRHKSSCGSNCNSGRTLRRLKDRSDNEWEENSDGLENRGVIGDESDEAGGCDDLTQNAASSRNEKNWPDSFEGFFGELVDFVTHF